MRDMRSAGFTLIEVMVVVVILAVLAAMVVPRLTGRTESARHQRALMDIAHLESAIDLYELDTGQLPAQLRDLLEVPPGLEAAWHGPYLKRRTPAVDPWGRGYVYQASGMHGAGEYDLWSSGPDGQTGTADDVTNAAPTF